MAMASLALAACGDDDGEPAAADPPDESSGAGAGGSELEGSTVRIAVASTGLEDIPLWPAIEQLEQQGVEVDITEYADPSEAVRALALGRADVTLNAFTAIVAAVNEDAPIKVIAGYTAEGASLVARSDYATVADLAGERVGIHGETSFTRAVAEFYARDAGVEWNQSIVPGSEVRAQALVSGQLDAAILYPGEIVTLEEQYPGDTVVLGTFKDDAPGLLSFVVGGSDEFVDGSPELAEAFVAALLHGYGVASEFDSAMEVADEHYSDFAETPELLEQQVRYLVDIGYWPEDASLTPESCSDSLDFLVSEGLAEGDPNEDTRFCHYDALDGALAGS